MLLKNEQLAHWKIRDIIQSLTSRENDYRYYMNLDFEKSSISEIPCSLNHLDRLDDETVLLHNTNRLTQPWKTGLKVDFRRETMKPVFGIFPREFVHFLMGKRKFKYQQHSDPNQVKFFLELTRSAISDGAITRDFINDQIKLQFIRADLFDLL